MNPCAPSLRELQAAMRQSLLRPADEEPVGGVLADGLDPRARVNIYRNTAVSVLVNALRLAFPAVQALVSVEFFEGVARLFCGTVPPRSAWLDAYGARFPRFLARLPQAASLPYLSDVARLEWKVNRVLHAPDNAPLDLAHLARFDESALCALRLRPRSAARLLRCEYPADTLWRAVLEQDDAALSAIRLTDGPVHLLVQRVDEGVEALRLSHEEWRISKALFAGERIASALSRAPEANGFALFSALLARACFARASHAANDQAFDGGSRS